MWWMSSRKLSVGGSLPALWAFLALLGLGVWSGCGKKLDCDAFSSKAKTCSVELYLALSGPETRFIERLLSADSALDEPARRKLGSAWTAERKKLAAKLVERLGSKCRKDHGRYKQSESLQACLSKRSCRDFAACVAKAVGVAHPAERQPVRRPAGKAAR